MSMDVSDLPTPVRRFLEITYPEDIPEPATLVVDATGRLRFGRLAWLPTRTRVSLVPGSDRVMDIRVRLGPVTILHGLDAFIDGRGFTKAVGAPAVGPEVDEGAFHTLILGSLGLPHSWPRLGFAWDPVDDDAAVLHVPFQQGVQTATLRFDRDTGVPSAFDIPRHKGVGSPKVDWRVELDGWRRFGSIWEPGRTTARWMDEPGPWFEIRTRQVQVDADVSDALARARHVLAGVRRA
ncbi:MAG TPA: DUF6544 family protein [Actinomycetota bacterium]|nr:DUF6544 family protein [Actinomycetota bacterium]